MASQATIQSRCKLCSRTQTRWLDSGAGHFGRAHGFRQIKELMESEEALRHYANLFRAFQKEQFFFAVGNNAIAPNEIGAYLVQDAHYLEALRDRLRDLAQLVEDPGAQSVLRQHSRDAEGLPAVARTIVERDLRLPELLHEGPDSTTRGYIDHQRQSVCSGGREGILSILPCYLFYPFFVRAIRSKVLDS